MGLSITNKLNHFQTTIPEGVAIPSTWFTANDYSPQLVRKYVQSGWLITLGSRVYARAGDEVGWEGILLGLQNLGHLNLHLGGVSALDSQGMAHHLPLGDNATIHVWGPDNPPGWINNLDLNVQWTFHRRRIFATDPDNGWIDIPTRVRDWTIRASAPERALLEILSEVDETVSSFTYAAELFEGLTTARPTVVTALLEACTHAKAKRLFLFLADYYHYPWLKIIDTDSIYLGKGKRTVTPGGRFNKRYQITVPQAYHAG